MGPVIIKAYDMTNSKTMTTENDCWDDSSIESAESSEPMDEEIHAISVTTSKDQKASDITAYKETTSYKMWFDAHVAENSHNVSAKSKVATLCGRNLTIFFRESDGRTSRRRNHKRKDPLPVNKIATMLTFDPNTGLYDHLIRGKAYIVEDGGRTKLSKHTLWTLQELISENKSKFHKYGADFSREGQMELLKACVQYKKGKWVPRSLYGMALTHTEPMGYNDSNEQPMENPDFAVDDEPSGHMKRSSASHWFISAVDLEQE
ncbi:MAG: hypothetical protein SGILL_002323 [Bacillariaceae sp.]